MSSVTIGFTGIAGAVGYNVYRSENVLEIGAKINLAVVPQVAAPYAVTYVDDAAHSTFAPEAGHLYYYRATSVNAFGVESLPSTAVYVWVVSTTYVHDDLQEKIFQALIADATLSALLDGDPVGRIRTRHIVPEAGSAPFVVFNREAWKEEKMQDIRRGTYPYRFQVYGTEQDTTPLRAILNRIAKVLNGNLEGLSGVNASVAQAVFTEGGPDLMYDEAVELYFLDGSLELVAELQNT